MNRKRVGQLATSAGVVLLATGLATLATHYLSFLRGLENAATDIRIATLHPPQPPSRDIVVAAITEETLKRFAYRSPIDRGFLVDVLQVLEKKGARLIGIDVLFDQATETSKDEALKNALRTLKTPLFVSYTETPGIVTEDQITTLKAFVPERLRAAANLATDPHDGTVRWIYPGEKGPGEPKGFARKAAELAGIWTPPDQVTIAWKPHLDSQTPPFPVFPAHALAALPDAWIAGKVVLVGAMLSITDRHRTPLAIVHDDDRGNMPGVYLQAHAIAQFLENRQASQPGLGTTVFTGLVMASIGMLIGLLKKGIAFNLAAGLGTVLAFWTLGMLGFRHGLPMLPLIGPTLALGLSQWMMDVLLGSVERGQRKFVQEAFSRYVSPAVVSQLVENPDSLRISGVRRELSFIFTDIAGFTTLSEKLSSEQLSDLLNAYLDGACTIILRHEGMVDKFIGDAIMAIFNAPMVQPDHAERAVRCAIELDAYAEDFRRRQNAVGVALGVTRLGVHTGFAVIGNFGSNTRMDFTALGDAVNTAARTEGVNKYFGTRLCCTANVVEQCPGLHFRPIAEAVLKGKLSSTALYSPVSEAQGNWAPLPRYREIYGLLQDQNLRAPEGIRTLHHDYPQDPLVQFHFERVQAGLNTTRVVIEGK